MWRDDGGIVAGVWGKEERRSRAEILNHVNFHEEKRSKGEDVGYIQLKHGDIFNGPSDLIVLPCSTGGTVTSFVRKRLAFHRIPFPVSGMELGDVQVLPFDGGDNIAQYVAFAASVIQHRSTTGAIRRIGEQLGECSRTNPAVRIVSAPLLGTGAGGLSHEESVEALRSGFSASCDHNATLIINVLRQDIYERLRRYFARKPDKDDEDQVVAASDSGERPPRVFVSYSHSGPDDQEWVRLLGTFLRENGIDVRLDIWNLRAGMDLPQFMTNEIYLADKVVIVSDESYAEKADGWPGGVGWETMIIQGFLMTKNYENGKFIVIVRSDDFDAGMPKYLKTKFAIHWPGAVSGSNCQELLRELFDVSKTPPLGERPVFL